MTTPDDDLLSGRAAKLRCAFDRSFAEKPSGEVAAFADLLAVRVAGDPFAIRLRDVAGLFADKSVTAMPSPVAELVGVAGFRGEVVPVYDLRALLGYAPGEASRWLLLVTTPSLPGVPPRPVALAFEHFEGHLRVGLDDIVAEASRAGTGHAGEVVRVSGLTRPIVHVASMLEMIQKRAQQQPLRQQPGHSQRER